MKNDHHTYIHTHYFYISYAHTHETQLYTHKIRVHLDFYILNRKHFLLFSLYLSLAFTRSYTYIECTNEHSFIHTNTRLVSGIHTLNTYIILDVSHYLPVGLVFSLSLSTPLSLSIISVEEMMVARDIITHTGTICRALPATGMKGVLFF